MQARPLDAPKPPPALATLQERYLAETTAPLDGMWLYGFVPQAKHFGLYTGDVLSGYFCVNDEGYLLQLSLDSEHVGQAQDLVSVLACGALEGVDAPKGAFVSTAEPHFLALCLDVFPKVSVHALMYQRDDAAVATGDARLEQRGLEQPGLEQPGLEQLGVDQLDEVVGFAHAAIGAAEAWLEQYYTGLIEREELFCLRKQGQLIATGEARRQEPPNQSVVDLGVIVAERERGRGLATAVLRELVRQSEGRGLRPICSTEASNIGAQRAIARAGFVARHRIVRCDTPPA